MGASYPKGEMSVGMMPSLKRIASAFVADESERPSLCASRAS
jgi:hypothetical protein